jgi:hypothetical protein
MSTIRWRKDACSQGRVGAGADQLLRSDRDEYESGVDGEYVVV